MVAGRPDWCISDKGTWGVPIAMFYHKDVVEYTPYDELLEKVACIG